MVAGFQHLGIGPGDVVTIQLPNWVEFTYVFFALERVGAAALDLIEQEGVTYIPSAPASLIAMLNDPELERFDLTSLRVVITGGASCPVETIRALRARVPGQLIELYGMFETGFHTFTRFTDDPEAVAGTIGRPAPGMALRLVDEHRPDVPPGAEGEIAAEDPSVHLGYHKNPTTNAELFTADGWFRTGDLGQSDAAGNVTIVGRVKDLINRGGQKFVRVQGVRAIRSRRHLDVGRSSST